MTNKYKYLKYLASTEKRSFQDNIKKLDELGYKNHADRDQFLRKLKQDGLIDFQEENPSMYKSGLVDNEVKWGKIGSDNKTDQNIQIKSEAYEFLYREEQNESNLKASWWGANGQWFSGIVALIAFVFGLIQCKDLENIKSKLAKKDSTIFKQKVELELLTKQLSTFHEEMQDLQKKSSKNTTVKK